VKKIVLLGIAVFLLALFLKTPASLIVSQIESQSNVSLSGVSGTLWKGRAQQLNVAGNPLGELSWTVKLWSLLTGSLAGKLDIQGDELTVDGNYAISFARTLTLDDTHIEISAGLINSLQSYVRLSGGHLRGTIDHLEVPLSLQTPPLMAAIINLEQGGLSSPFSVAEGNYQLKIEPKAEGILLGTLNSSDAPVDLKGTVSLNKDWRYQTDLKIKTTPQGRNLQGTLSMIGRPQADGYIHIKESAQLKLSGQ